MAVRKDMNPLDAISSAMNVVGHTIGDVASVIDDSHIPQAVHHMLTLAAGALKHVPRNVGDPSTWYTSGMEDVGTPFVEAFMRGGLGVNPDANNKRAFTLHNRNPTWGTEHSSMLRSDSGPGVRELKRLIGFCIAMPFAWAGIESLLKFALGQRVGGALSETVGKIPTEMGISWAMGMALSSMFETAAGRQLEELVNTQLHPNRLDMMTLRTLARQHKISSDEFWAGLDLLGYPDDLKSLILQLDTQQLALTDLQALYITGKLSEGEVHKYLERLGFSDSDVDLLQHTYITHADTQASSMYRNAVRVAYERQQLTADQFRDMLTQIVTNPQQAPALPKEGESHYDKAEPQVKQMVRLEHDALDFQTNFGRTQQSVTTTKRLYESGHISHGEALHRLEQYGYARQAANDLVLSWQIGPLAGKPALTSAKILAYEKSGVFSRDTAYGKLLSLGMAPKDAQFLADNPDTKAGPYVPPFSIGTIIQAYLDHAVTQSEANDALLKLGLSHAEATEELRIANARMHNPLGITLIPPGPFPAGTPKSQEQQELAAYRLGEQFLAAIHTLYMAKAVGDQEAVNMLQELGMMQADAGILWASWYVSLYGKPPAGLAGGSL